MIHLYDIGNTNYGNNGDVILQPISGSVRQVAGGGYDLTMEVPFDPAEAWKHIVPGAVVRVPVPKETIPNAMAGQDADIYKTNTAAALRAGASEPTAITYPTWSQYNTYSVGSKVTQAGNNYICTYWDSMSTYRAVSPAGSSWWERIANYTDGSSALATLPSGTELYYVETYNTTWYKMMTAYGLEGYIKQSQVTFYKHVSSSEIEAHVITDQLFRLREPTENTDRHTVSVTGQHVSYDLAGILIDNVSISQAVPAMAISRIVRAFMMSYPGEIATNINDSSNGTYTGEIKGKNGIYALMDPDKGIVSVFDAKLTRDNWDIFVMKKTTSDPVCTLAYGKNVKGITRKRSSTDIVTRIVPVAKDAGGNDLYLPEKWVDSSLISNYPVIIMERLNVSGQVGKAKGENDQTVWTESDLYDEMRAKAGERFSVDHVDQVKVDITVQFEMLGDTVEYAWLKPLQSVLLYDKVIVKDDRTGLNVTVDVTELEYDIVKEKITGLKLSNVDSAEGRTVTGYNVRNNSISANKLMDDVVPGIVQQAVDKIPEFAQPFDTLPEVSVSDGDPTLAWGTRSKVGTVGTTDLHVTMPANPSSASDNNPTLAWGTKSKVGTVSGTDLHVTMPSNPASASDNNPTLAWGSQSKVGTVNGTDLHVTMPSNPLGTVTTVTPTKITTVVEGQTVDVTTLNPRATIKKKAGIVYVYLSITTAMAVTSGDPIMGSVPVQGTQYPFSFNGGYRGYIDGSQVRTSVAIPAGTVIVGFVAFPE